MEGLWGLLEAWLYHLWFVFKLWWMRRNPKMAGFLQRVDYWLVAALEEEKGFCQGTKHEGLSLKLLVLLEKCSENGPKTVAAFQGLMTEMGLAPFQCSQIAEVPLFLKVVNMMAAVCLWNDALTTVEEEENSEAG